MKTKIKRLMALLLTALLLVSVLGACGGDSNSSSSSSTPESKTSSVAGDSSSEESSSADASEPDSGEITKLKVWGFGYTATTEDCQAVSEAVSEITRDKIGVEVEITINGDGEKLNLAMNSGEEWDLVNNHAFSGGLQTMVSNGLVQPIDDLVYEYGQEMIDKLGEEYLALGRVGDHLYSVPGRTQVAANSYGLFVRKDFVDEVGANLDDVKSYDEMFDILVKIKEKHPDMDIVAPTWGGGGMQKTFAWDNLGTGFWNGTGILENSHDSSTTVVNMFETESYKNFVEAMYKWKQAGLMMADGSTSAEGADVKNGKGVAIFNNYGSEKSDAEKDTAIGWGMDCAIWEIESPFIVSDAGGSSMVIPSSCKNPEKAMQLWNLMYTDPEIDNILCNGVEGMHYEYTDDTKQYVRYKDGCTWGYDYYWCWPNGKDRVRKEGTDLTSIERDEQVFESADSSPALGFKFDNTMVMNEITACENVIAKYETALRWGELDPAETLPKFNQELYDAGLQNIIDEKQKQLDEFLGK